MSKTELRLLKLIHFVVANCIDEPECANLAQFLPPRMSENPKKMRNYLKLTWKSTTYVGTIRNGQRPKDVSSISFQAAGHFDPTEPPPGRHPHFRNLSKNERRALQTMNYSIDQWESKQPDFEVVALFEIRSAPATC
jgi:hypothetical protein